MASIQFLSYKRPDVHDITFLHGKRRVATEVFFACLLQSCELLFTVVQIGKRLADSTSKKVVVGVLLIVAAIPLLSYDRLDVGDAVVMGMESLDQAYTDFGIDSPMFQQDLDLFVSFHPDAVFIEVYDSVVRTLSTDDLRDIELTTFYSDNIQVVVDYHGDVRTQVCRHDAKVGF